MDMFLDAIIRDQLLEQEAEEIKYKSRLARNTGPMTEKRKIPMRELLLEQILNVQNVYASAALFGKHISRYLN